MVLKELSYSLISFVVLNRKQSDLVTSYPTARWNQGERMVHYSELSVSSKLCWESLCVVLWAWSCAAPPHPLPPGECEHTRARLRWIRAGQTTRPAAEAAAQCYSNSAELPPWLLAVSSVYLEIHLSSSQGCIWAVYLSCLGFLRTNK